MSWTIAISVLFSLLSLLGLVAAATSESEATQYMGIGLVGLSWFIILRYYGHVAERRARRSDRH
ncbi:MAG: hypothetical protein OXU19_20100 [bacterium]|nr:hypothetical protein [bacterium]MDE0240295.1 hypothetical protein [bacterium]MDE0417536.1 hypothetical protein [bacterium]